MCNIVNNIKKVFENEEKKNKYNENKTMEIINDLKHEKKWQKFWQTFQINKFIIRSMIFIYW